MEDVQDGIKISIQDGVTEDPKLDPRRECYLGLSYIVKKIPHPTVTTAFKTTTDSLSNTASITTILATGVA